MVYEYDIYNLIVENNELKFKNSEKIKYSKSHGKKDLPIPDQYYSLSG